jgi:peptidoglycan/LPS O-acetylase OafA/YrhL
LNLDWLNRGTRLQDHLQNDHQNNFTLIRLIAALIVVKQHSFSAIAQNSKDSLMSVLHMSALGLPSFFFISGLLVSQSLELSSSWKNFLWKRFLRLYPAACLSILFCAFILGPIVTTWSIKDYFSSHVFYQFLSTCFLIQVKYQLPGVFDNSLIGHSSINSSLWTVCLELKLYLGLLFFWLLKIPGEKYFLFLLILLFFIAGQVFPNETDAAIYKLTNRHINIFGEFTCTLVFLTGVLANMYKQKITIKNSWLLFISIYFILSIYFSNLLLHLFLFIFIPAVNLFVATKGISMLKKITPKPDLSYGIYVFAFPLQQIVGNYLRPTNTWTFFLLTILVVLPFAFFSWYMVEKKALSLKRLVH